MRGQNQTSARGSPVGRSWHVRWASRHLEVVLAACLLIFTLVLSLVHPASSLSLVLSLSACAGVALCSWSWIVGTLLVYFSLLGMCTLPRTDITVAFHACLAPSFSAARKGRPLLAVPFAFLILVTISIQDAGTAQDVTKYLQYQLAWAFLLALAIFTGWLVGRSARHARWEHSQALHEQRLSMARHLHDTTAHEMTQIAMLATAARVSGQPTATDIHKIERMARSSIDHLRDFLNLLQSDELDESGELDIVGKFEEVISMQVERLRSSGFKVVVTQDGDHPLQATAGVCRCMARVAREGLNNVHRHGDKASPVVLMTEVGPEAVTLLLMNAIRTAGQQVESGHRGLQFMRNEVIGVGGVMVAGLQEERWMLQVTCPIRRTDRENP